MILSMGCLASYSHASQSDKKEYDLSEAKQLISYAGAQSTIIQDELKNIENKMLAINPELVEQNTNKSNNEKLIAYRNYLARASFDWYKEYFINKLKERSQKTGRQIKSNSTTEHDFYQLDNGRLDLPECQKDIWQICPYPDKHEEFYIDITDYGTQQEIFVQEDDADRNVTQTFSIYLSNDSFSDTNNTTTEIILDIDSIQFPYDEWAQYREQERAYTAKFGTMSKKELRNYKRDVKKRKIIEEKYPGNFPTGFVIGYNYEYINSKSQSNDIK